MHIADHFLQCLQGGESLTGHILFGKQKGSACLDRRELGENIVVDKHVVGLLVCVENIIRIGELERVDVNIALVGVDRHIYRSRVSDQHIHIGAVIHHAESTVVHVHIAGGVNGVVGVQRGGVDLELVHVLNELVVGVLALLGARFFSREDPADRVVVALQLLGSGCYRHLDDLDVRVTQLVGDAFVQLVGRENNFRLGVDDRLRAGSVRRAHRGGDGKIALIYLVASADNLAVKAHIGDDIGARGVKHYDARRFFRNGDVGDADGIVTVAAASRE